MSLLTPFLLWLFPLFPWQPKPFAHLELRIINGNTLLSWVGCCLVVDHLFSIWTGLGFSLSSEKKNPHEDFFYCLNLYIKNHYFKNTHFQINFASFQKKLPLQFCSLFICHCKKLICLVKKKDQISVSEVDMDSIWPHCETHLLTRNGVVLTALQLSSFDRE